MITTQPKNHNSRAKAVKNTWGQRCDVLYFVSSQPDPSYPIIDVKCDKEDHNHLWCKNRNGIIFGFQEYVDDFDWFLKADDDTYVIVENLRHLLSSYDTNDPLFFSLPFVYQNVKYPSGGAGYIFSKETITRLVNRLTDETTDRKHCHTKSQDGADDIEIGRCLEGLGVQFVETRDKLGRGRFLPFLPFHFLKPDGDIYKEAAWLANYSLYKYKQGFDCCSDSLITFHYVNAPDQYVYEYFIYRVKIHDY
ncbi:unnamed protein product [Oppiella nova]|uniref:N-acetylgalactosaminide beta-1,3-galactosyltransferase n=1 Tax=Oppiella nova TaxID=334625 RepID=A0A7R9MCC3_9ACAR|nr:unnamed protein product [Oppiella nova]CAG2174581.1 unnamed protein product [Oppiella nova]